MKLIKKYLLAFLMVATVAAVHAQPQLDDPKYGATEDERRETLKRITFFNAAARTERVEDAVNYLREILETAPEAHEGVYNMAAQFYKNRALKEENETVKKELIDSMLMLYDLRYERFGHMRENGKYHIRKNKAIDYYTVKNMSEDPDDKALIYKFYMEALADEIDLAEEKMQNDYLLFMKDYFTLLQDDYILENIETDSFLNEYGNLCDILDVCEAAEKDQMRAYLDQGLISSGAADCEALEKLFKPQLKENPDDLRLTKKIVALMRGGGCDSDFLVEAMENYYRLEPSTNLARLLADTFKKRGDEAKATEYLKSVLENETDPVMRANLLLVQCDAAYKDRKYREAAALAKQAIGINPELANAYLLLAFSYMGGLDSQCRDVFSQQTAYWLVVDVMEQARRRIPSGDPRLSDLNSNIAASSKNFPTPEEIFMRTLKVGDPYTVSCGWISGKTTVRARK